jgi:hypothetical protein
VGKNIFPFLRRHFAMQSDVIAKTNVIFLPLASNEIPRRPRLAQKQQSFKKCGTLAQLAFEWPLSGALVQCLYWQMKYVTVCAHSLRAID